MESVVSSSSAQNTCMICLGPLLVPNALPRHDDDDASHGSNSTTNTNDDDTPAEIGSVFPCGHVFHLACFQRWSEQEKRCPTCNQDANLFCKLYLSAPLPPSPPAPPPPVEHITLNAAGRDTDCDSEAATAAPASLQQQQDDDDEDERQLLLDLRTATQAGPAQTIRKVVSLKSKNRKLRRESRQSKSELESTQLVLELTQEELQLAQQELQQQRQKVSQYKGKLARIQSQHWERHRLLKDELMHQHSRQILDLRKELQDVKLELALRNRQLQHAAGVGSNPEQVAPVPQPALADPVQAEAEPPAQDPLLIAALGLVRPEAEAEA